MRHAFLLMLLLLMTPSSVLAQENSQPVKPTQPTAPPPTWRALVGLDAAYQRLRADLPLGRGIEVGYVEGNFKGGYLPNANDARLAGIEIIPHSGEGPPSAHATRTATIALGAKGIAPGIRTLHAYLAPHWLGPGYLNLGSADPPRDDGIRLWNHSWINGHSSATASVLRRVDYQIDQHDVLMCVGVNNGRDSAVPPILASAYNVITVGTAKNGGDSSGGYTTVMMRGRCKPDIVGPRGLTSFATPAVTACCAILLERADAMEDERARRSELIKAVLLAGAVKPKHWTNAVGKPLDEHLGAGIVNIDRSLQVLDAGPVETTQLDRPYGWDFVQLEPGESLDYRFETARLWRQATFVIVWHRRIDGRRAKLFGTQQETWLDIPRIANIDLQLTHYDDTGQPRLLAQSVSTIDNVEHLYRPMLTEGRYRLKIVRQDDRLDEAWDVALAWWMRPDKGD